LGDQPREHHGAIYASSWHAGHAAGWHDLIDYLRGLYPGVEIYCIPYGQSALELRLLFEASNLPDVDFLVSAAGDAIYSDSFGHADDILVDLGQLVWLNAIYDVDLTTYAYDPGYITDLKGIAQSIMDNHDMQFAPHPHVPAMSPWGLAFLGAVLLAVGTGSKAGFLPSGSKADPPI
jgi:hypothetical protein